MNSLRNSYTHLQFTPANTQTKNFKRVCLATLTEEKKYDRTTMYKNNSRNSSKFKGCSPLQLLYNLIGKCHAIGYYSYTNRWG